MLADDELAVGSDLHQALRGDGVEAAAAGVAAVHGHHGEVVVHALADTLVGAHGAGVDLRGAGVAALLQDGLFLRGGLHDHGEFLLLGLEVLGADGDVVLQGVEFVLAGRDLVARVIDVLLVNLAEEVLVLDFLVQGVVLAGVGDGLKLVLVLLDNVLVFGD